MTQFDDLIRERAYAIWESEGRPEGRERQHWEQAAREVLAARSAKANPKAKAAKPARSRSRQAA